MKLRKHSRRRSKHARSTRKPNILESFTQWFKESWCRPIGRYLITTVVAVVTEAALVLFLLYGPIAFFRELIITSAMTTLSHQYYATTFYSDETIFEVMNKNKVEIMDSTTKTDEIQVDPNANDITVRKISGSGWNGFVMEISNPAWVRMGIPQNFGTKGQKIPRLIEDYGAVAGIDRKSVV